MRDLIEEAITGWFGERCKSKDTDDMPWVVGDDDLRCICCLAWEQYDALVSKHNA